VARIKEQPQQEVKEAKWVSNWPYMHMKRDGDKCREATVKWPKTRKKEI
jgi:hypothetical protein